MRVPPGYSSEQNQHAGEDMAYVISGECWLKVDDKTYRLTAGDTIHFQASKPHSYGNDSQAECLVLSLNTMQLFSSNQP
jgi:quercetin dioxygenase-like cupin family protein